MTAEMVRSSTFPPATRKGAGLHESHIRPQAIGIQNKKLKC